jgi:tetratricopeptide (TPR) repeat protein
MEWTDRLEADYANVRAALEFAFDSPELVESGRALAITLGGSSFTGFWGRRSHFSESRFWLEKALESGRVPLDPAVKASLNYRYALNAHIYLPWPKDRTWLEEAIATFRTLGTPYRRDCANALTWLGYKLTYHGERELGLHCLHESLAIGEAIGDRNAQVFALNYLLWAILNFDRDYDTAWTMAERGLSIARETGDGYLIAVHLHNMAEIETQRGRYVEAWRAWHQVLELHSTPNPPGMMLQALRRLGDVARILDDYGKAEACYRESLAMSESVGWLRYGVVVKLFLAYTLLHREQVPEAAACITEALKLVRDNGWFDTYPLCLLGLTGVLARQGNSKAAVRLLGTLDAHHFRPPLVNDHRSGDLIYPEERLELEHYQSLCRTDLGGTAFDALFADGRSLTLEEAFALAEEHLSSNRNRFSSEKLGF